MTNSLSDAELDELLALRHEQLRLVLEEIEYEAGRKLWRMFPANGPLRRELYARHLEFFAAGATHRERLFLAANRVGKTEGGLYEVCLHLTGAYPDWWEGARFDGPIRCWVCGDTNQTLRDIIQQKLLGDLGNPGAGILPRESIVSIARRAGIAEGVETVRVKHRSGGESVCTLKSYEQGRLAFQGTAQHVIHLDEEAPEDIKTECLLRTMATGPDFGGGLLLLTFTPLQGLTDTVLTFLPDGQLPDGPQDGSRYVVNAGWDDVPHLSTDEKATLLASIPPYQRDARSRGLPVVGAGAIYPVPEEDYLVEDFALPKHWLRAYGLDVGWNRTAAVWGAYDKETDIWYLYSEHYRGEAEPSIHADAVKARGGWIPGVVDPAARGRSQHDGLQLLQQYLDLGLDLQAARNAVESGLYECWQRLSTGRLKVFTSLANWRRECRLYHRDEKGRIVKTNDHLMDAMRYLVMSGGDWARAQPVTDEDRQTQPTYGGSESWMA